MGKQIAVIALLAAAIAIVFIAEQTLITHPQQIGLKIELTNLPHHEYSKWYEEAYRVLHFDSFCTIFNKKYHTQHELLYRKHVFLQNQLKISNHNKLYLLGKTLYFMAHNTFSDLTAEQFMRMYTWKQTNAPLRVQLTATSQCKGAIMDTPNPPQSKSWSDKVNQMKVPGAACAGINWAIVAVSTVESLYAIRNTKLPTLSIQQLLQCSYDYGNEGCNGGFMDQAYWYIIDNGIATETEYQDRSLSKCKYVPNMKFTGFSQCARIPSGNYSKLISAVVQSPVSVALNFSPDMIAYKGGIYDGNCTYELNQGMVMIGYGGKTPSFYWTLRYTVRTNSSFGMAGQIHIIRDGRDGPGKCGLQLWPSVPQNLN